MNRITRAAVGMITASLLVVVVAGCGPDGGVSLATFPAGSLGPGGTAGPAVAQTRGDLVRVLGERNLVLQDSTAAFRPPEDGRFTLTPRALYQVILPEAPSQGFIVVYEFPDPTAAREAASVQARYLASGPARVQSPFGTRHIMRLVGATVVLYSWVPDGIEDPRQPDIQAALETLGVGVPIPS
ncbi:MAG: hypothetical protein ACRDIL_21830 [Candidatus Limnocylindrales bacterium]